MQIKATLTAVVLLAALGGCAELTPQQIHTSSNEQLCETYHGDAVLSMRSRQQIMADELLRRGALTSAQFDDIRASDLRVGDPWLMAVCEYGAPTHINTDAAGGIEQLVYTSLDDAGYEYPFLLVYIENGAIVDIQRNQ